MVITDIIFEQRDEYFNTDPEGLEERKNNAAETFIDEYLGVLNDIVYGMYNEIITQVKNYMHRMSIYGYKPSRFRNMYFSNKSKDPKLANDDTVNNTVIKTLRRIHRVIFCLSIYNINMKENVMIYTSYFAISKSCPFPISITATQPTGFSYPSLSMLAVPKDLSDEYKTRLIKDEKYIERYNEMLKTLNVSDVLEAIEGLKRQRYYYGSDCTLICWEKPGIFCHRNLVAEWLKREGHLVAEFDVNSYVPKKQEGPTSVYKPGKK